MPSKLIELIFGVKTRNTQDVDRLAQSAERALKAQRELNREAARATTSPRSALPQLQTDAGRRALAEIDKKFAEIEQRAKQSDSLIRSIGSGSTTSTITAQAAAIESLGASFALLGAGALAASANLGAYAARTQTLEVVTRNLARVNNINSASVEQVVRGVAKQGIVYQEALQITDRLIFAQLDLRRATDLARLAQDAAVIAGINSTQALEGIVNGIVTRQPRVLRTYGIIVDFNRAYQQAARSLGRELTDQEKIQVALNEVLAQGAKVTGSYEAAMSTAGKRATSLNRLILEAKEAVGREFVPAYGRAITVLEKFFRLIASNSGTVATLATGVTAAGAAAAAFRFTPGPPIVKGAAAAIAGGATLFAANADPIQELQASGSASLSALSLRRDALRAQLAENRITKEVFNSSVQGINEQVAEIRRQVASQLAGIFIQRGKGTAFEAERVATGLDLGSGVKVTAGEVLASIKRQRSGGGESIENTPLLNVDAVNKDIRDELEARAAELAKEAEKSIKAFVQKSFERTTLDFRSVLAGFNQNSGLPAEFRSRVTDFTAVLDKTTISLSDEISKARTPDQAKRAINAYIREIDAIASDASRERFELAAKAIRTQAQQDSEIAQLILIGNASAPALNRIRREQLGTSNTRFATDAGGALVEQSLRAGTSERRLGIEAIQRDAQFQSQRARFAQNEVAAINAAAQARIRAAEEVFRREEQLAEFNREAVDLVEAKGRRELEILEARRERELALLQLQRQQREQFAEGTGRAFDAAIAGGDGLRALARSQLLGVGRQISVNSGRIAFDAGLGSGLRLPGQGTPERPTLLGRLLQGTPFGLDPAKASTDRNTTATDRNTLALEKATAIMGTSGSGGGIISSGSTNGSLGPISSIGSSLGIPSGVFQGAQAGSSIFSIFRRNGNLNDPLNGNNLSALNSAVAQIVGSGTVEAATASGASKFLSKNVGKIAAAAGGAAAIISGIQQGGAKGAASAASGALAVASLIPGPQQPFLLAGSLAAGALPLLFGDPVKKRRDEIENRLKGSIFEEPNSQTLDFDAAGRSLDFDARRGRPVLVNVTIPVQTIDSKSFLDYADGLQVAVADALDRPGVLRERILGLVEDR